jgi:hypothetical protein
LVALIQTPNRFRTKRSLWGYSGLALETRISAEYCYVQGQLRRSKKVLSIRGLNKDHNYDLKGLFKAVATTASVRPGPFQEFYQASVAKGIEPTMARLTLASVPTGLRTIEGCTLYSSDTSSHATTCRMQMWMIWTVGTRWILRLPGKNMFAGNAAP